MIPVLAIEARRSPMRLWFPGLVLLDLAVLFGRARWWIGVWPQASAAAQIPSFYLGPVVGLSAAWAAGRIHRQGVSLQLESAARPRWQMETAQLAGTLLWVLLAYAAGVTAAAAATIGSAGPGFLWPGYLVVGMAVIVGCASFGHLVGRWSSSRLVAPLACGLTCFIVIGSVGSRFNLFLLVGDADVSLSRPAIASRVALALAVGLVAVTVRRPRRRGPTATNGRQLLRTAIAVGLLAASVEAFRHSPNLQRIRTAPSVPLCTETSPKICLWPEDRKYLYRLSAMASRLSALPAGLFRLPPTFYEQGLRPPTTHDSDGIPVYSGSFYIREGAMWDVGITMADDTLEKTLGEYCTPSKSSDADLRAVMDGELSTWLTARITGAGRPADVHGGPPGVDVTAVGDLIARPQAEQVSWVRIRLSRIHNIKCA